MADKAKIRVGIQLDEAEYRRLLEQMDNFQTEIDRSAMEARVAADQARVQNAPVIDRKTQFDIEDKQLSKLLDLARKYGKEQEFMTNLITKGEREAQIALEKSLGIRQQANQLTKEEIKLLQIRATELRHQSIALRRAATDLHLFAQSAQVAGTAIVGGMVLAATKFAEKFRETNAVAAQFAAVQGQIAVSTKNINQEIARELLPFMRQALRVIQAASRFIQENPEVVGTALRIGTILIAVGTIGKGIALAARLTADFMAIQSSIIRIIATQATRMFAADKEVAAAELQNLAADKQLEAGAIQNSASTGGAVAKGALTGAAGFLTSPTGVATLIGANLLVANKLSHQLDQIQPMLNNLFAGLGDTFRTSFVQFMAVIPGGQLIKMVEDVRGIHRVVSSIFGKITQRVEQERTGRTATTPAGRMDIMDAKPGSVALSENLDELLKAYEDYVNEDLKLVQNHYSKRKEITDDALAAERKETKRYLEAIEDIRKDLAKKVSRLTADYNDEVEDAEREYLRDRVDIIQDAADDVLRIEEDFRNKLRKMARDHAQRMEDLLAARDALGLVKEQRRYLEDVAEARREANEERSRRRQEIAERLAELEREYAEQKQRRLEDYQERVAEAREQAAERLADNEERHKEEMEQIREQAAEKLAEEQRQFIQERARIRQQFIQRIRDIDAFYLGELNLRRQRQTEMIRDLDAFLVAYRGKLNQTFTQVLNTATASSTGGVKGTRATGGYATAMGKYVLAEQGKEFVLNAPTTRAAEQLIGGQLNQQTLLAALSAGGKSITWNDYRRFDSSVPLDIRRAIMDETRQVIREMLS